MDYLLGYLAIGLATTAAAFAWRAYVRRRPDSDGGRPYELSPVGAIAAFAVVTLGWPISVPFAISVWWQEWRRPEGAFGASPPPQFSVKLNDLVDETNIAEIERTERVHDPLGAVPDQAFGHLNGAWERFVRELQPADRIWTFWADWAPYKETVDRYSGYAATRDGNVVDHFTKKIVRERDVITM